MCYIHYLYSLPNYPPNCKLFPLRVINTKRFTLPYSIPNPSHYLSYFKLFSLRVINTKPLTLPVFNTKLPIWLWTLHQYQTTYVIVNSSLIPNHSCNCELSPLLVIIPNRLTLPVFNTKSYSLPTKLKTLFTLCTNDESFCTNFMQRQRTSCKTIFSLDSTTTPVGPKASSKNYVVDTPTRRARNPLQTAECIALLENRTVQWMSCTVAPTR